RIVVGIDDGDDLAGAILWQRVDAVGLADLVRGVNDPAGVRQIVHDAVAADGQGIDDQRALELAVAADGERGGRRVDQAAGDDNAVAGERHGPGIVARLEDHDARIGLTAGGRQTDVAVAAQVYGAKRSAGAGIIATGVIDEDPGIAGDRTVAG